MSNYRTLGSQRVKKEYTEAHCRRLAGEWFNAAGEFLPSSTPPSTRERLWNCMSLLGHGDAKYARLAASIILKTPIDHNHFEGIAAVEVLIRFGNRLGRKVCAYLEEIVRAHLLNLMEVRFGGPGTNNFTCMTTWFLLAAGQVIDRYEFKHPLGSVPEVYTGSRVRAMGMNALRALAHHSEHEPVFGEFNSPTYTPISLHSLAKIVELIDDPDAKRLALEIELKLWREVLGLYHPNLGLACGPYSRSYRIDVLGQNSQMRILMCYVGLSKDRSVVKLFDEGLEDLLFHHDGDVPFAWSGPAWQMATEFHAPADAIEAMRSRRFPQRFEAPIYWGPFGHIMPKNKKYISVQGDCLPGGRGEIVQTQHANWSLGYRSQSLMGHSFPILFHYALHHKVRTMQDVRTVTAAVMFHGTPREWVPDQTGQSIEAGNFNHEGKLSVHETKGGLAFDGRCLGEWASIATGELSVNAFVPTHFVPVSKVTLNGKPFDGAPIRVNSKRAVCRVEDAGFVYEIAFTFPAAVDIQLHRWANFIRFAGFLYKGHKKRFTAKELDATTLRGRFRVIATR
jgi:hypothetical protein